MPSPNKPKQQGNKAVGIVWYFISTLFPAMSSFVIFSIATRQVSPAQLGSVSLALTVVIFLVSICGSGFGDALIQKKEISNKHISTVFVLVLGSSIVSYFICMALFFTIPVKSFDELFKVAYIILGIKLILDSCSILPLSILTRKMEFKKIGVRTILCSTGATIVCVPILLYGGGIWAMVFSQITSSVISFIILWTSAGIKPKLSFCKEAFGELKHFGLKTTSAKIVTAFSIDNFVIGIVGSLHTLGIYAFSRRVFSVINDVLTGAMSNISYPLYSSLQDERDKLNSIFLKTTFISTLISFPAFTGLFLISDYVIPIVFGQQWVIAIFGIKCCCFIGFISCIGTLQLSLIKGLGNTGWILKYQLFQQVTTGLLVLIFAKSGANAVMLAITIKTYLVWPYTVYYVSNLLRVSAFQYASSLLKPFLATVSMVLAFQAIKYFYFMNYQNEILFVLTAILICAIIYSFIAYIISKNEIKSVIASFRK